MKLCAAQTHSDPGDINHNIESHKRLISLAASHGADIIIFPELSVTGYEPKLAEELATSADDERFDDFQILSNNHNLIIGIGVPLRMPHGITISLVIFQPQQAREAYHKKYIHPDEEPFFVSAKNNIGLLGPSGDIALAICYEISVPAHAEDACRAGAKVYIASVAKSAAKINYSLERMAEIAKDYSIVALMADCVGAFSQREFAGKSGVWNEQGRLTGQLDGMSEGILIYDTETRQTISKTL